QLAGDQETVLWAVAVEAGGLGNESHEVLTRDELLDPLDQCVVQPGEALVVGLHAALLSSAACAGGGGPPLARARSRRSFHHFLPRTTAGGMLPWMSSAWPSGARRGT